MQSCDIADSSAESEPRVHWVRTFWSILKRTTPLCGDVKGAMAQLTCDCLNVKINLRDTDLNGNSADIPSDCADCDFFQSELTEVKISPCSVEQEHPYLVHKTAVKDWLVHRCVNCGVYTHAFPSRPSHRGILVSRALQSEPAAHQRLLRSSDYSPLFRIVLRGQDPNIPSPLPAISGEEGQAFESLQSCISGIQQQVNTYLLQEEASMEERIRAFEEEQRTLYSELETQVKNEKKKMISVLFNNMQSQGEESVSINGNKPALRSTKSVPMTTAVNISPSQKVPTRRTDNPVPRPRSFRSYNDSPDNEGMFMLDDEEDTPFYVSDEEDTDDSLFMDDSRRSSSGGNLNSVLSTSVPVAIPNWRLSRKIDLEDDEKVHVPAPEEMAASMQALARSVHNDDITNIFGDLPRPRLNTFTGTTRPVRK